MVLAMQLAMVLAMQLWIAGDDKPAEPCTKRRKTHMAPEVKEWFCSHRQFVKRDWSMMHFVSSTQRMHCAIILRAPARRDPRRSFSHKTHGTALGRSRTAAGSRERRVVKSGTRSLVRETPP